MDEEKKFNEIDMECEVDPEDDEFGGTAFNIKQAEEPTEPVAGADDRDLVRHTGIILDFGDDEKVEFKPEDIEIIDHKPITVQMTDDGLEMNLPQHPGENPFKGINEIDMECEVPDDFEAEEKITNSGAYLDFGDEDEQEAIDRQLVNEQIVEESKREAQAQIDQGVVEDDYYDELQKKHAASNKKGSYNYHFHISGNPKAEQEIFNHDMTPQGPIPNIATANAGAVGDTGMTVAAQGMGMCEGYNKLFEELLFITGCEGNKNEGKFCIKDKYGDFGNRDCETIQDLQDFLNPFVIDCFIIPLQVETGNNFNTCKEWSDWYTPEMEKKYPQCKKDIQYCDLCANHLPDCKLF